MPFSDDRGDQSRFLEESGFAIADGEGSLYDDDEDDDELPSGYNRKKWIEHSHSIYVCDLILGNLNLCNLWRVTGIAFALSIQWTTNQFGMFNFLIPYSICLVLIAWPLLIAEIGLSQCVRGSAPKTFGSLSLRSRFGGLSWIGGVLVCFISSALCAYAFAFLLTCGERYGTYYSTLSEQRSCVQYGVWVPQVQPRMCFPDDTRLDAACYGSVRNCPMWDGEGRCMAVPWGPASEELLVNAEEVCPWLLNDFPIYCGARHLHNLTTNGAMAVATSQAFWSDYGSAFSWRLPVGFLLTWLGAVGMAFLRTGYARLLRMAVGAYAVVMLLVLLFATMSSLWEHPGAAGAWLSQMVSWQPASMGRVEIWAHAVVQSIFSFSLAQNVVPHQHSQSPKDTMNIVRTASLIILSNTAITYMLLWIIYLAYASLSTWTYPLADIHPVYGAISLDVRNMAMGTFFTVMETWFDNSSLLDGRAPRPVLIAGAFWLAMFLCGVMGVSRSFSGIVNALFTSAGNWNLGLSRWIIILGLGVVYFLSTVIMWFGVSWSFFMTFQHVAVNMCLPLFALAEVVAIGWVFGWYERAKHFGSAGFIVQSLLYCIGALLIACASAYLSRASQVWRMVASWMGGLGLVVFSVLLPPVLVRSHDVYGRKHSMTKVLRVMLFGSVDHLRKELNYRTCHTARFMKLTLIWSLLVKYILPLMLLVSWFSFFVRSDSLATFSPYRPFFNDQADIFQRVESMFTPQELAAPKFIIWVPFVLCFSGIIVVLIAAFLPIWFDWHVPRDTDEQFWNVRKAVELFASHVAMSQTPVRLNSSAQQQSFNGQSIYQKRLSEAIATARSPTKPQSTQRRPSMAPARVHSPLEPTFAPSSSSSDDDSS